MLLANKRLLVFSETIRTIFSAKMRDLFKRRPLRIRKTGAHFSGREFILFLVVWIFCLKRNRKHINEDYDAPSFIKIIKSSFRF